VYAATYCDRESSDGRYGGSELVELPYRYPSAGERSAAAEEAVRIEVVPTAATATIKLQPGISAVLMQTRQSAEFEVVRQTMRALGDNQDSPLLTETRFHEAWRGLCAVYAENSAITLEPATRWDHRIVQFAVFAYLLARVRGLLILPALSSLDLAVAGDAAAVAAMEKLGPKMLRGFRALVTTPALEQRLQDSVAVRCSAVPLTVGDAKE
jgi:hypothetical protein